MTPNPQTNKTIDELVESICLRDKSLIIPVVRQQIEALITEARIEALDWALNDYNMSDTDTRANLEQYIAQLKENK